MNYKCRNCKILIGQSQDLLYKIPLKSEEKLNFKTFDRILNYQEDDKMKYEFFTNLYCRVCKQEIGMKINQDYSLYNTVLEKQQTKMKIQLYSLKKEILQSFYLDQNIYNVQRIQLLRKELNEYDPEYEVEGAIIIHKCEQRVLLLSNNGIYTQLMNKLWRLTGGNVCLILIANEDFEQQNFIKNVSIQGQQPELQQLYQRGNLIFYDENIDWNNYFKRFAYKSYDNLFQNIIPQNQLGIEREKEQLLYYYLIRSREDQSERGRILRKQIKKAYNTLQDCVIF